ncbi:MAG TPA: transcriptional repressor LexA [Nitrospirota bacterium]|nr:transcriptional repressor LexA [Nitrospirota bacterium]
MLTERQQEILEFIRSTIASSGIPPSMREIGMKVGIRSTNGVEGHLAALERGGYIVRDRGKSRGIMLRSADRTVAPIPILGRVAAGLPVVSPENRDGELLIDLSLFSLRSGNNVFALKVKGDSMVNAHITDNDTLLVRVQSSAQNGDIVVAMVEGEPTVKRYFVEKSGIRLQPENSAMKPIYVERGEFRILGKVVGVVRKI